MSTPCLIMCAGFCPCFQCINEAEAGVVENMGRYSRVLPPGLNMIQWPLETIISRMSLKVQHLEVSCDTKTKDNVFVQVIVAVQYRVVEEKVSSAFYKLTDAKQQIRSYVYDVIRSAIPGLNVDDTFVSKDHVASTVQERLSSLMSDYGYEIIGALVTDINPDAQVRNAMNEINASQRLREAATEKAEAEKILLVKSAEADAESKYLNGMGIARQRRAIVEGLQTTVSEFSAHVPGTGPQDVMDLLLMTQYFEMLREMGRNPAAGGNTLFLPHGPQAVKELRNELTASFMTGFHAGGQPGKRV